ncbi:hypothetical protein CDAR_532391 [Caerostris darwini]|uniref:Uncharacterized protein n=1 Tax=Caerostris darwini TaxID=1538125 RepID=A0AAV4QD13_9ARAC|nr:hypothetical protein CDAR_532391 [Caerostris darwini]
MEDPCVYLRYFQKQQMSETRFKEIRIARRREGFCWMYMQKLIEMDWWAGLFYGVLFARLPCEWLAAWQYFQRQQMSETGFKEIRMTRRSEEFCYMYMQKIIEMDWRPGLFLWICAVCPTFLCMVGCMTVSQFG